MQGEMDSKEWGEDSLVRYRCQSPRQEVSFRSIICIVLTTHRITCLNLEHEDDIPWVELIDECWNSWTTEELRDKWAALKVKATVDMGATHRGESRSTYLLVPYLLRSVGRSV
jgi:hypothetical protein